MTFEGFLDGLNKGGFAFLGMVLIAAILAGGLKFMNWLFTKGWPTLMETISKSSTDYKASVKDSMAQTQQVIDRQSQMLDTVMDGHKTIISKMDSAITKIDVLTDKLGGR